MLPCDKRFLNIMIIYILRRDNINICINTYMLVRTYTQICVHQIYNTFWYYLTSSLHLTMQEHDLLFWIERLATALMFMEPYRGIIPYSLSSLLFLFTNSCYIIAHFTNPKKRSTHTKSEEISGQRIQKLRQQKFSNTPSKLGVSRNHFSIIRPVL